MILSDFTRILCMGKFCFQYSYFLWLTVPMAVLLYFVIKRNFVRFMSKAEQEQYQDERKALRIGITVLRILIFLLVLIAMASPSIMETRMVKGNPRMTILTDNSYSFDMFDKSVGNELYQKLKARVPVELRSVGSGDNSAIGDGILANLQGGENILVISDGNNNKGKLLGDVILFANSINSTISTLDLQPVKNDVSVSIEGPYEVITETEGNFIVTVNNVGDELSYTLEIRLDDNVIFSNKLKGSVSIPVSRIMNGNEFHKITASLLNINGDDFFMQNNVFYKSIKVVQRPSLLFVSKKISPLVNEFKKIYDVTPSSTIPDDFSEYMAVVLNDIPASDIIPKFNSIQKFVSNDGNGLVVIGGESSYDRGKYKGSLVETILPVKIGAGEDSEKSDVNVVVIVDVSGTTTEVYNEYGQKEVRDYDKVIKALGASVLDSLDKKNNVGIVVVGTQQSPYVGIVSEIVPLGDNKDSLVDKISRLAGGGQTAINPGLTQAIKMLGKSGGGKNIILISDGRGLYGAGMNEVKNTAKNAAGRGIKTYVVGVGAVEKQDTDFLSDLAELGNGYYWPADASNRLKILFGEPDKSEEEYYNSLSIIDSMHFITDSLDVSAVISGYNYAIPKAPARLLVATNKNIPIITVWRYGIGRIVSIATDDGSKWAGEMLTKENSKLLTRSVNWAIGSLGRKKGFDVSSKDTTVDGATYITVISKDAPKQEGLSFSKIDTNTYISEFKSAKEGFYNVLGADVAVNYNNEYLNLGINKEFINMVNTTGGSVFNKDDTDTIVGFVIEKSRRIKIDSSSIVWPFAIAALILFIIDIFVRKLWENTISKRR